ncbi:MAG: VanW family protein [Clostridia bacterium]|nr:VanW family protein [Clostridia bacterium]
MGNTLKMIKMVLMTVVIGICCYSCSENNSPQDAGSSRTESDINIVSGIIPAPSTQPTTVTEVVRKNDSYVMRISNSEITDEQVQATNLIDEATIVTNVTTVDTSSNAYIQTTEAAYQVNYNEVDNSPLIWKNGYQYYVVEAGDSWSSIAGYLGVDPIQLAAANNSSLYDVICVGDELYVPNEYVDYTVTTSYTYAQETSNQNDWNYTNSNVSGTCLSSVTLRSAPDSASWNNIEVSLATLNGLQLAPGETFNWDNYIGWQTTSENYGYMDAPVLVGTDVGYATGGGVCVTSTALFQAARDAGMAIYERHDHSRGVSYAVPGDEASVSYGCMNLIFNNTTGNYVTFYTSCYYGSVTVSCYIS